MLAFAGAGTGGERAVAVHTLIRAVVRNANDPEAAVPRAHEDCGSSGRPRRRILAMAFSDVTNLHVAAFQAKLPLLAGRYR